jgi:predicted ribosomally synthesized peptide with SipW-like signal peptide
MKLTTLRNLMASMLIIGVAGSVIGVGSGTFALFNATTNNTGNTFTTDDLTFSNTPNGVACVASAKASSNPSQDCAALVTISNTLPGDSKLGLLTLNNGSAQANVNIDLAVTASPSTALDTTSAANNASSGLGLLMFRCRNAGNTANQACTGVAATLLVPVYGTCASAVSIAAATGVTSAVFGSARAADNQIPVGDGGVLCTAGNTASGISSVALPTATVGGPDAFTDTTKGLAPGHTDNLAIAVYLPGKAGNTLANLGPSTLKFAWNATQVVGGPR